jgi:hypothetical protein
VNPTTVIVASFVGSALVVVIGDAATGNLPSGRQVLAGTIAFGAVAGIGSFAPGPAAGLAVLIAAGVVLNYATPLFAGLSKLSSGSGALTQAPKGPNITASAPAGAVVGANPAGTVPAAGPAGALFSSLKGVTVGRVDYGLDFAYSGAVPAYAIASGTVAAISGGWGHVNAPYQTGTAVYIRLDTPIAGYPYMYYAEGTPAAGIRNGEHISVGQQVMMNPGEIGIIPSPSTATLYQTPQPSGIKFKAYLQSIGAIP